MNYQEALEFCKKSPGSKVKSANDGSFIVINKNSEILKPQANEEGKPVNLNTVEKSLESTTELVQIDPQERLMLMEDLKSAIEDSSLVKSQEECDEWVFSLTTLIPSVDDKVIIGNANRRIRELEQIRSNLPSSSKLKDQKLIEEGIKYLKNNPPECVNCHIKMLLKSNDKNGSTRKGSYFWGCQNFSLPNNDPKKCYVKKWLSAMEEKKINPSD
jgi:hypothetical protein